MAKINDFLILFRLAKWVSSVAVRAADQLNKWCLRNCQSAAQIALFYSPLRELWLRIIIQPPFSLLSQTENSEILVWYVTIDIEKRKTWRKNEKQNFAFMHPQLLQKLKKNDDDDFSSKNTYKKLILKTILLL